MMFIKNYMHLNPVVTLFIILFKNKYGQDNELVKKFENNYKIYNYLDAYNALLKLTSE